MLLSVAYSAVIRLYIALTLTHKF